MSRRIFESMTKGWGPSGPAAGAVSFEQTPENMGLQELFDEWLGRMEKDVLQLLGKEGSMSASGIAKALKLSERATLSVIYTMAQHGTVRITEVQVTT